jgi:hypothetical protein
MWRMGKWKRRMEEVGEYSTMEEVDEEDGGSERGGRKKLMSTMEEVDEEDE